MKAFIRMMFRPRQTFTVLVLLMNFSNVDQAFNLADDAREILTGSKDRKEKHGR